MEKDVGRVLRELAKSVRIMKEAMKKPGGRTYENAVELQRAESNLKNFLKENIRLVKA